MSSFSCISVIPHGNTETAPATFSPEMTHAMFQALDMNGDGSINDRDIRERCSRLEGVDEPRAANCRAHTWHYTNPRLKRLPLFCARAPLPRQYPTIQAAVATIRTTHLNSRCRPNLRIQRAASSMKKALSIALPSFLLSLSTGIFRFLREVTNSTVLFGVRNEPSLDRESAKKMFEHFISSDSTGWVTAADLQMWRQMLPPGQSEDVCVQSFLASKGVDVIEATDKESSKVQLSNF